MHNESRILTLELALLDQRQRLRAELFRRQNKVQEITERVEKKEHELNKLKSKYYAKQAQLEQYIKRQQQKPRNVNISDAMNPSTDATLATLPLLHPFRQLLSVAQAVTEERKLKINQILDIFNSNPTQTESYPSVPINPYTTQILILISECMNIPLPFPIAFGSMTSSPLLAISDDALVSGTYPSPRVLHPSQKRLAILESLKSSLANKLLIEDVVFVAAVFGVAFASSIDNFTVLTALISATRAPQFGNPFASPALRAAAFESKDEKITDNHEWTVLDSS